MVKNFHHHQNVEVIHTFMYTEVDKYMQVGSHDEIQQYEHTTNDMQQRCDPQNQGRVKKARCKKG